MKADEDKMRRAFTSCLVVVGGVVGLVVVALLLP